MSKRKIVTISTVISLTSAIFLAGCSRQAEPSIAATDNANQAVVISNTNSVNTTVNTTADTTANTVVNSPGNYNQNNSAPSMNAAVAPPVNETTLPVSKKTPPPAAVNEPKPVIGSGGNDMLLVIQSRNALSADKQLLNSVIVDSKEGNVVLTGKVASAADKAKAAQLIQESVKGIKSIKNNITVSQ